MKKPNPIKEYEKACLNLVNLFCETYFTHDDGSVSDVEFLDDDVTGILEIGDCYLTHETCYEYLKNEYTPDEFFERYWAEIDHRTKHEEEKDYTSFPGIVNWKKFPELRSTDNQEIK